jgi:hypothetical protein
MSFVFINLYDTGSTGIASLTSVVYPSVTTPGTQPPLSFLGQLSVTITPTQITISGLVNGYGFGISGTYSLVFVVSFN